ncbi:MAG: type I glyceraldehyde-3-phosphate dehydrogenase [Aigarchaeota archaeon]|nr:type I glyceraldehyde-3-phosphate dehydrogenase [Aigarchaeota archaeon]MDW8092828.1 type I glyceraldehyde-3-phosphate dehydrogenase [Nitrososphaerota archaeon]
MIKIGINGMGRIGRLFLRAALRDPDYGKRFKVVAYNELADSKSVAYLLKYDSIHGRMRNDVRETEKGILIDGEELVGFSIADPASIKWSDVGVDVVIESTGRFTSKADSMKHLKGGAKRVVISAPSSDADVTIVPGVNSSALDISKHVIISGASCTTNCLAPMVKVLLDNFGIIKGYMTTVHAYTNDQRLLDLVHKDLRRARAAAQSIIPTTTGAASALHLVIPEVKGKLHGIALRVPVANGSLTDLSVLLKRSVSVEEVNRAFQEESQGRMRGIIEYTEDPIVSIDVIGNPHSCVFDASSTIVLGNNNDYIKVFGWYDNEWGYSNRLVDIVRMIESQWTGKIS